jgi:NAD(P)H-dependent flavin oxidoreductase YrpB (nitropropane dioxygenase family)
VILFGHAPICPHLGIAHPIIQAPISCFSMPPLAAVCKPGALGAMGCGALPLAVVREGEPFWSGQAAPLVRDLPARQLVEKLVTEALAIIGQKEVSAPDAKMRPS